jgi:branched-chain amino acid transport system substrate-binding protein
MPGLCGHVADAPRSSGLDCAHIALGQSRILRTCFIQEGKRFMRNWYRSIFYALGVATLAVVMVACGGGGTGSSTPGSSGLNPRTLCIGTDLPISGTDGFDGQPAENGADLAVRQNLDLGHGYKLQVRNFDDVSPQTGVHDGPTGAQNITQMLSVPCIIAEVGPFNSGVAGAEIPVAVKGGLAMISPANTNPGLTLKQYSQQYSFNYDNLHPAGKPNVYFRIPANDVVQGKVDADLTIGAKPNGLGASKVYVVDDTEPYGKGLADFFTQEFTAKGGTVLDSSRDEITANGTSQLPQLAAKIVAAHPDAVFYGGVVSEGGGLLKAQLVAAGYTGPMVGGDGIADSGGFLAQAGAAAENTYGTVAAPDLSAFTSSVQMKFIADYKAAFGTDPGAYSANSYDAAMIEIQAMKSLIDKGIDPNRTNMIDAISKIQYDGLTGHISFDQNGDNAGNKVFSIYVVEGGKWKFLTSVNA